MGRTAALLGRRLGLGEERCELLRLASPLHDIGKLVQEPHVLHKAGPLTASERRTMEAHTESGYTLLAGSGSELLELAASIALTHHERWDGGGYPHRLAHEEIPLEGRIASVADVFDALTSDRAFRPAFSNEQALRMMQEGRATLFDPLVLDAFLDSLDGVFAIYGSCRPGCGARPAGGGAPLAAAASRGAARPRRRPRLPARLHGGRRAGAGSARRNAGRPPGDRRRADRALRVHRPGAARGHLRRRARPALARLPARLRSGARRFSARSRRDVPRAGGTRDAAGPRGGGGSGFRRRDT